MLSVDYRSIQQRLQKLEGEHRQEVEKVKALQSQIEQEHQKKNIMQTEITQYITEVTQAKTRESQLSQEVVQLHETKKFIEDELLKIKREWSMEQLKMKDIQENLETEQYFATLYKTQVSELKEELEEKNKLNKEFEEERESLKQQCQIAFARADSEALARSIAEETVADLEKEKTMKELELKDLLKKHCSELSAKEMALATSKDLEQELKVHNEQLLKEKDEILLEMKKLQEELDIKSSTNDEIAKLHLELKRESMLKQQAVNKLHEILNRKDLRDSKGKGKISSADLRRREKDLKKQQQELALEKEKLQQRIHDLNVSSIHNEFVIISFIAW